MQTKYIKTFLKAKLTDDNYNLARIYFKKIRGFLTDLRGIFSTSLLIWIPIGIYNSLGKLDRIVFFYDLRVCTYRFDALISILYASQISKVSGKNYFDFVIYDPKNGVRQDGPVTANSSDTERLHYLTSVILETLSLFSNLNQIHYVRSYRELFGLWFGYKFQKIVPRFYSPIFPTKSYLLGDLLQISRAKRLPPPFFETSMVFDSKVKQFLDSRQISGKFLTLTIREKSWEKAHWNLTHEELQSLSELVQHLRQCKLIQDVLLVKDFEAPYPQADDQLAQKFEAQIVPEASLSVRFRASLYSASTLNLCSTNGPSILAVLTGSPCVLLNKDTWNVGDGAEGDFYDQYSNLIVFQSHVDISKESSLSKIREMLEKEI